MGAYPRRCAIAVVVFPMIQLKALGFLKAKDQISIQTFTRCLRLGKIVHPSGLCFPGKYVVWISAGTECMLDK